MCPSTTTSQHRLHIVWYSYKVFIFEINLFYGGQYEWFNFQNFKKTEFCLGFLSVDTKFRKLFVLKLFMTKFRLLVHFVKLFETKFFLFSFPSKRNLFTFVSQWHVIEFWVLFFRVIIRNGILHVLCSVKRDKISTKQPFISSCFVFCKINFLTKNRNPSEA
jgi:hypothetical protein